MTQKTNPFAKFHKERTFPIRTSVTKLLSECKKCEFFLETNKHNMVRCNKNHVVSLVLVRPGLHDAKSKVECHLK